MVKKCMFRLTVCACLTFAFAVFAGCGGGHEDSGAYDKAVAAYESGDYELAVSSFREAAEKDGRTAEAYRGIGLVYLSEGSYGYAVDMFDMSLDSMQYPNEEFKDDVLLYKAEALMKNEQTDEALDIYALLEESAQAGMAYALEGKIALDRGDTQAASEKFDMAVASEDDISIYLIIYEAYRDADLEGYGAEYLDMAVESEPKSGEDNAAIGIAYDYLNDHENAIKALNKAMELGYDGAADILGKIYIDDGDISSAKSLFMDMLGKNGNNSKAYNGLAMCSIEEEDYESALIYIEQGLGCSNESTQRELLFNEVVVYEKMLDFDTAAKKAQAYMIKYPQDKEMENELIFLLHS